MGAVHGVYLKYVGLGTLCGVAAYSLNDSSTAVGTALKYSAAVNLFIAALFQLQRGQFILGKSEKDGSVPLWSYLLWSAFHGPTWLYTFIHTELGKANGTPVASEVSEGWYIGGVYSYELKEAWAGVLDLTVEFPEACIAQTMAYKLVPVWDGTPPTPQQLEEAADFCVAARAQGKVLVHCAHGRGRSTCCMVAALTKSGAFATWEEAFEACKKKRPVVKLNSKMRRALAAWAEEYQKKRE